MGYLISGPGMREGFVWEDIFHRTFGYEGAFGWGAALG